MYVKLKAVMCVDDRRGAHHTFNTVYIQYRLSEYTLRYASLLCLPTRRFHFKTQHNINSLLNNISTMEQQKLSDRHIFHMAISPLHHLRACGLYRLGKQEHTVITTHIVYAYRIMCWTIACYTYAHKMHIIYNTLTGLLACRLCATSETKSGTTI